jgi:hypothetical protein
LYRCSVCVCNRHGRSRLPQRDLRTQGTMYRCGTGIAERGIAGNRRTQDVYSG